MTFVTGDNNFSVSKIIVSPQPGRGTHTTIAAAIASASSGDTIMIKPGTYTENLTINKNLIFYSLDGPSAASGNDNVIISGNASLSGNNLSVEFNNLLLQGNAGSILTSSGTGCNVVYNGCSLDCGTATGLTYSGSGSSIYLQNCFVIIGAGGTLFSLSGASLYLNTTQSKNVSATAVASTAASSTLEFTNSYVNFPISSTGTGGSPTQIKVNCCTFGDISTLGTLGFKFFTLTSFSYAFFYNSYLNSYNTTCIEVGATSILNMADCQIESSYVGDVIYGTGIFNYNNITFVSTSTTIANTLSTFNYNATTTPVKNGGTGRTSATAYGTIAAGTTSTGAFQVVSPGSSGQVLTSQGASALPIYTTPASVITTQIDASTTWNKNAATKFIMLYVWGGGASGGSGRRGASTAAGGGAAGCSGAWYFTMGPASTFNNSETVTIGGTTTGGLAQTSDNTNGNQGAVGNISSFGSIATTASAGFGNGGTTTTATGGSAGTSYYIYQSLSLTTAAGAGSNTAPSNPSATKGLAASPGGGGSGADSVTVRAGANGGAIQDISGTITVVAAASGGTETGTIDGANGTDQNLSSANHGFLTGGSGGGGGGGQHTGLVAGKGGNGGIPGGGGGGGGGSLNGTNSGAGGNGAQGRVIVFEFC